MLGWQGFRQRASPEPDGAAGVFGAAGTLGSASAPGALGTPGAPGALGAPGAPGTPGVSAPLFRSKFAAAGLKHISFSFFDFFRSVIERRARP